MSEGQLVIIVKALRRKTGCSLTISFFTRFLGATLDSRFVSELAMLKIREKLSLKKGLKEVIIIEINDTKEC